MRTPIAFFAFRRPEHTRLALEALVGNVGFNPSLLYVFCDGSRHKDDEPHVEETRRVIQELVLPGSTVIHQEANRGLANSIIKGVSELSSKYGKVIVLEDDLVTSPYFLTYMENALERYANADQVMQISGYMFPIAMKIESDALFLPFTTSWGWGTWDRAWRYFDTDATFIDSLRASKNLRYEFDLGGAYPYYRMLKAQLEGKIDSWAIRWYLSVFSRRGLTLFPKESLVSNTGFDGTGTHCSKGSRTGQIYKKKIDRFPPVTLDESSTDTVFRYLRSENRLVTKLCRKISEGFVRSKA